MTDWQPIETAPKDGSAIDLWVNYGDGGARVTDAYWRDNAFGYAGPADFDLAEGWAAPNMGYDGAVHWVGNPAQGECATHWMPQPEPPADD